MTINPQPIPSELSNGLPVSEEVVEEIAAPEPRAKDDDISDLFEGPKETDDDMATDDLVEVSEEDVMGGDEDMSDLVDVSNEDVMGKAPKQKNTSRQIRRTNRRYVASLSLGGMNL